MIDLHMHSDLSNLRGDSVTFYGIPQSINVLKANGIKYFSFTEHDKFDHIFIERVIKHIKDNKLEMKYFSGVEISIRKKDGKIGHILVIFKNNEKLTEKEHLIKKVCSYYSAKVPKEGFDKLLKAFDARGFNYLLIPHFNKANEIVWDDISEFAWSKIKFLESFNINGSKVKKFNDKYNKECIEVKFSDAHHWREYKRSVNDEEVNKALIKELENDK